MKITNAKLKQIIKEELDNMLSETQKRLSGYIYQLDPRFNRYSVVLKLGYEKIARFREPNILGSQETNTPETVASRIMHYAKHIERDHGVTEQMIADAIARGDIETPSDRLKQNSLNEVKTASIKSGRISYASQAGVYDVSLSISSGKTRTNLYGAPEEVADYIRLRVSNLQLNDLRNVAYNIARVAKRDGYTNIREDEILAALESGNITLPR